MSSQRIQSATAPVGPLPPINTIKAPSALTCNEQVMCWIPERTLLQPLLSRSQQGTSTPTYSHQHHIPSTTKVRSIVSTSITLCAEKMVEDLLHVLHCGDGGTPSSPTITSSSQTDPFVIHLEGQLDKIRRLKQEHNQQIDGSQIGGSNNRGGVTSATIRSSTVVHRVVGVLLEVRTISIGNSGVALVGYIRFKEEEDNRCGAWIPMDLVSRKVSTAAASTLVPPFVVMGIIKAVLGETITGGDNTIAASHISSDRILSHQSPLCVAPIPSRTPYEPVIPHGIARTYLDTFKTFIGGSSAAVSQGDAPATLEGLLTSVPLLASGASVLGRERLLDILTDSQAGGLALEHPLKVIAEEHLQVCLADKKAMLYLEGRLLRDVRCLPSQCYTVQYAGGMGGGGGFMFPPWYYSPAELIYGGQGLVGPRGHFPQIAAKRLLSDHEALRGRPPPSGLYDPFKLKDMFLCPFTLRQYTSERQLWRETVLLAQLYIRLNSNPSSITSSAHPIHTQSGPVVKAVMGKPQPKNFPFCPRGNEIYSDELRGISIFEVTAPRPTTTTTVVGSVSGRFAPLHVVEDDHAGLGTTQHEAQASWGRYLHRKGLAAADITDIQSPKTDKIDNSGVSATLPNREYCRNMFLLAKSFLENKLCGHDVHMYSYYVVGLHASVHFPHIKDSIHTLVNQQLMKNNRSSNSRENTIPAVAPPKHVMLFGGFYSWEAKAGDGANLACIMTLPCLSSVPSLGGLGQFLVRLSYEMAYRRGFVGSPERPLSDLGERLYHSYWRKCILQWGAMVLQLAEARRRASSTSEWGGVIAQSPTVAAGANYPTGAGGGHGKGGYGAKGNRRGISPEPTREESTTSRRVAGSKRERPESADSRSSSQESSSRSTKSVSVPAPATTTAPLRRRLFAVRRKEAEEAAKALPRLPPLTDEFIRRGLREWGVLGTNGTEQDWIRLIQQPPPRHNHPPSSSRSVELYGGVSVDTEMDGIAYTNKWLLGGTQSNAYFEGVSGVEVLTGGSEGDHHQSSGGGQYLKCTTASIAKWCGIEPADCQEVLMDMGLLHCTALGDPPAAPKKPSFSDTGGMFSSHSVTNLQDSVAENNYKFLSTTSCPVKGHYLSLVLPIAHLEKLMQADVDTKRDVLHTLQTRAGGQVEADRDVVEVKKAPLPLAFDSRLLTWCPQN